MVPGKGAADSENKQKDRIIERILTVVWFDLKVVRKMLSNPRGLQA